MGVRAIIRLCGLAVNGLTDLLFGPGRLNREVWCVGPGVRGWKSARFYLGLLGVVGCRCRVGVAGRAVLVLFTVARFVVLLLLVRMVVGSLAMRPKWLAVARLLLAMMGILVAVLSVALVGVRGVLVVMGVVVVAMLVVLVVLRLFLIGEKSVARLVFVVVVVVVVRLVVAVVILLVGIRLTMLAPHLTR